MLIATLNGATSSLVNKEIEVSVHKIGFTFQGDAATLATPETTPDPTALMTALLGDTQLTITRQDGMSSEVLFQRLKLSELAEISTHNEGVIHITRAYSATAADNDCSIEFTVEVSNESAFKLDDNSKLILNLEGKPANVTLEIETIDHPIVSREYIKYDTKFVNANSSKDFSIDQHYALALPIANVTTVELSYANGKTVVLTKSEIKKLLRDTQDEVYVVNNKTVYGFNTMAVLNVAGCTKATVLLDASKNIYLVKNSVS